MAVDNAEPQPNCATRLRPSRTQNQDSGPSEEPMETDDEIPQPQDHSGEVQTRPRGRPASKLFGKNGFSWSTKPPSRRSDRINGTENNPARLLEEAIDCEIVEQFWDLLFSSDIIDLIVEHTNIKIEEVSLDYVVQDNAQSFQYPTDPTEMRAYIGVLYHLGLWKNNHVDKDELWSQARGPPFYRCVFPRHRFFFLQSCLRFDNKSERDPNDRFAPIREIFELFMGNCRKYYCSSGKCTVDERWLYRGFRGRCIFRMYMKSKPDKYGLKLVTLNDSDNGYLVTAIPYLGKTAKINNPNNLPVSEYFFKEVTAPIHGSHRTVTCDNWFTSIPLLQRMSQEPYNLTMTGTLRKNKKEIPLEMKIASPDPPGTKFCFSPDLTLLSYTPKKSKIVLVVSNFMHRTNMTGNKSNIILHYNNTKSGTDTFDQLCHAYTVTARTNKWPMRVFFGMVDQAMVNARILWKVKLNGGNKVILHLVAPHLKLRMEAERLRKELRVNMCNILEIKEEDQPRVVEKIMYEHRKRCELCERKKDKKTAYGCGACHRPACEDHRIMLCSHCCGDFP